MANTSKSSAEILPLYPLSMGEKLLILIHRIKQRRNQSATDLASKTGFTRTYIPKLYLLKNFNQKQINILSSALDVPEQTFTDDFDARLSALEQEVAELKSKNNNLEGRLKIVEAENNGLRKALMN